MSDITFQATVYKVQTLVDMGLRVTLDLPEDAVMQAAQLMECKRAGVELYVTLSTEQPDSRSRTGVTGTRRKRKVQEGG